jgi:hypothetical protein
MARRRRRFHGCLRGRWVGSVIAEFVPVIAVVTNEVGDLAEGLVRDDVFEGHD